MKSLGKIVNNVKSLGKNIIKMYSLGSIIYDKQNEQLPYIELDFIEATGVQYMNTNILNYGNIKVEDNVYISGSYIKEKMFYGGRKTTSIGFGLYYNDYRSILQAYGSGFLGFQLYSNLIYDKWTNMIQDKTGTYINNILYKRDGIEIDESNSALIYLDTLITGDIPDGRKCIGRRGKFKIWRDDILIFDAIPCKLISTGEVGRWDLISNTFIPNIGDGNYLEGSVTSTNAQVSSLGIQPTDNTNDNIKILNDMGIM